MLPHYLNPDVPEQFPLQERTRLGRRQLAMDICTLHLAVDQVRSDEAVLGCGKLSQRGWISKPGPIRFKTLRSFRANP